MAMKRALDKELLGPRVLIIGEKKAERKEIWVLLVNYATKLNMQPIFVDLDKDNDIFCNGFIGAAEIKGRYPSDFMSFRNKLIYFTGKEAHRKSYLKQVQTLGKNTILKMEK